MWTFANENPLTFAFLCCVAAGTFCSPFRYAYLAYKNKNRAKNIAAHGWPTPPLDADGDVVFPEKDE